MKKLINVIEYLQQQDSNGNYTDILDEINDGIITIDDGKKECFNILNRWKGEQVDDMIIMNQIDSMIELIK